MDHGVDEGLRERSHSGLGVLAIAFLGGADRRGEDGFGGGGDPKLRRSNVLGRTAPTWIEDDESKRRTRVEHTLRSIELAEAFGAKTISLQPGGPLIGTSISRELAGERFAEGLRQMIPAAKLAGIVLGIEPEPGLFIESSA